LPIIYCELQGIVRFCLAQLILLTRESGLSSSVAFST
jgi:hypothetical protein